MSSSNNINICESIQELFSELKIRRDSTVMLHGDAGAFLSLTNDRSSMQLCADAIVNFFGDSGTLVVPTFTYSATKSQVFSAQSTPSSLGTFSEVFRNHKLMKRSSHPNFSVSVYGKKCIEVLNTNESDAFGEGTIFDFLYQENADLVTLGCSLNSLTFTHYVEQIFAVPYRYIKTFWATIEDEDKTRVFQTTYFVRRLNSSFDNSIDLSEFRRKAFECGKLNISNLGRLECAAIKSQECFEIMKSMLESDELSLVRGKKS